MCKSSLLNSCLWRHIKNPPRVKKLKMVTFSNYPFFQHIGCCSTIWDAKRQYCQEFVFLLFFVQKKWANVGPLYQRTPSPFFSVVMLESQFKNIFLPISGDWEVIWKFIFMVGSNKNYLEKQIQVSEWVGLGSRGVGTVGWLTAPTPCRRLGCPNLRNLSASQVQTWQTCTKVVRLTQVFIALGQFFLVNL